MNTPNQIKVSVIIPFYGVEEYIGQCLESVSGQTLREIEIICVDDASTDGSAAIVRRYAAADQRIRLLHNPVNRGVSVARNRGLAAARGDYLYVIDSDDFLRPDAIEKLHARALADDLDLVFSDAWMLHADGTTEHMPHPFHGKPQHHWCGHAAWWFIFRRSLLTHHPEIRFPPGAHPMEDTVFSFLLFNRIRRHGEVNEPLIHYRQHDAMVTKLSEGPRREAYLRSAVICLNRLAWFVIGNPGVRRLGNHHACVGYMEWLINHATALNQGPLKLAPHARLLLGWLELVRAWNQRVRPKIHTRLRRFLLQRKVTHSGRVTLKVCKIPLLSLRIKEKGFARWLAR